MTIQISILDLPENATMAHAAFKAGMFPSVSQARKNGWDRPLEVGTFKVGKRFFDVVNGPVETVTKFVETADKQPGFWPEYEEPKTRVQWAIQFPLDERFANRLINAYLQDAGVI